MGGGAPTARVAVCMPSCGGCPSAVPGSGPGAKDTRLRKHQPISVEAESAAQTGRNGQAGSLLAIQQVQVLLGTSPYRHLDLLTYGPRRCVVSSHQHKPT